MKDVVARATITTSTYYNTGFIYLTDTEIKGLFSLDRVNIFLDGENMIMDISNNLIYIDECCLHHKISSSVYQSPFPYKDLYIPNDYTLYDKENNLLILSIESVIYDSDEKSRIINLINSN